MAAEQSRVRWLLDADGKLYVDHVDLVAWLRASLADSDPDPDLAPATEWLRARIDALADLGACAALDFTVEGRPVRVVGHTATDG